MQVILDGLSEEELAFLLKLLNAAKSHFRDGKYSGFAGNRDNLVDPDEAIALDRYGDRLRKRYEQNRVKPRMRLADSFYSKPRGERKLNLVRTCWSHARIPAVDAAYGARNSPRSFVHAPRILGVPAHRPPVLINEPSDLVNWLVFRAFANRQMARFVPCTFCGKFGLRLRAKSDSRFCSSNCQVGFNLQRKKDPEFAGVIG
jgi:hypothetical protein